MSDLRRRALGGGKTPSRKSQSKAASKNTSRTASRSASAAPSRTATDDEAWDSEGTVWSFGSMDAELSPPEDINTVLSWQDDLQERISRITDKDRKRLAVYGLEEALIQYNRILVSRYTCEEIEGKTAAIVEALLKSIKVGKTDKEIKLAASALSATVITDPDCIHFSEIVNLLQRNITDHASLGVKKALIHALSACAFYSESTDTQVESVMDFFHEIVENDGHNIGAGDDPAVVSAAIEEWGFLATVLDDAEDVTDRSIDAFVDQLDSSETDVQVAAGEVIALLFEKGYRERDDDDDSDDNDNNDDDDNDSSLGHDHHYDQESPAPVQKYTVYNNTHVLKQKLVDLTRTSAKNISKRNRRTQHTSFANILHTVEHPLHGPNYSRALDIDGRERGSRLEIKVGRRGTVKVNRWWKLVRWNGLRRFLGSGVLIHWEYNRVVFDSLPLILEAPKEYKRKARGTDRRGSGGGGDRGELV